MDVCTKAAFPTADSGELESIVSVIPPLTLVPFTVGSDGTLLGDVGLLQAGRIAPSAPPNAANVAACVQNCRRVWPPHVVSFICSP
jgi:hypothetical protein